MNEIMNSQSNLLVANATPIDLNRKMLKKDNKNIRWLIIFWWS